MTKCTSSLKSVIRYYKKLVTDFHIDWTPEIEHKIIELYPNDIAIESYILTTVLDYLEEREYK